MPTCPKKNKNAAFHSLAHISQILISHFTQRTAPGQSGSTLDPARWPAAGVPAPGGGSAWGRGMGASTARSWGRARARPANNNIIIIGLYFPVGFCTCINRQMNMIRRYAPGYEIWDIRSRSISFSGEGRLIYLSCSLSRANLVPQVGFHQESFS